MKYRLELRFIFGNSIISDAKTDRRVGNTQKGELE